MASLQIMGLRSTRCTTPLVGVAAEGSAIESRIRNPAQMKLELSDVPVSWGSIGWELENIEAWC